MATQQCTSMNSTSHFPGGRTWWAIVALLAVNVSGVSAASIPVQSFHKDGGGVTLSMSPGKMRLTVCSEGIIRVMYSPTAVLPAGQDFVVTNHFGPATSFRVAEASGQLTITTRKLKVAVDKASGATLS